MKKIFLIIFLLFVQINYAQISIGKEEASNENVILEFDDSPENARGIIVPIVDSDKVESPADGTFIMDKKKGSSGYKIRANGKWIPLTTENEVSFEETEEDAEDEGKGIILGAETSEAGGVLVLESSSKVLVLPRIANPHLTVKNPSAGMMCYDTESHSLAIFDGNSWSFWK